MPAAFVFLSDIPYLCGMRYFFIKTSVAAIVMAAAVACSTTGERIGRRLDAAEAAMNENPEEALEILGSIDSETIQFAPRKARYTLLLSQALDKNYLDVEDDSLIMIAVNFYSKWIDNERFAQSLYYAGRVHFNAKDYAGAIVYGTQAAEKTKDDYLAGLISRLLADCYHENWNDSKAGEYYNLAANYFHLAGKERHASFALASRARMLISDCRYDESRKVLDSLFVMIDPEDVYLLLDYYNARVCLASMEYKYADLKSNLEEWNSLGVASDALYVYTAAARTFAYYSMADSASYYLNLASALSDSEEKKYHTLAAKAEVLYGECHYKEAIDTLYRVLDYQNHIVNQQLSGSLESAVTTYWKSSSKIKSLQNKILAVSILASLLLIWILISYARNKRREAETYRDRLASAVDELDRMSKTYDDKERKFIKYLKKRQFTMNLLASENASIKIEDALEELKMGKRGFKHLIEELNDCFDGVMVKLSDLYPGIKDSKEYCILAYLFYGFSLDLTSLLTGIHKKSLYNIKYQWSNRFKELGEEGKPFLKLLNPSRPKS